MSYYPKLMNYGLLMNDRRDEPLVLNATDIYFYADGPFNDIGYMSLKGLDLTTVITEGVYDELLDWSWPTSEPHTMYF